MTPQKTFAVLAIWVLTAVLPLAAGPGPDFDSGRIGKLPTLDNGRVKPMDTYARETIRFLTGSESFGEHHPMDLLLQLAFRSRDWTGKPLLSIGFVPLKEELGVGKKVKYLVPAELLQNQKFHGIIDEVRKAGKKTDDLPKLQKEAVILYHKLSLLEGQIDALGWKLVPHESDAQAAWTSIGETSDKDIRQTMAALGEAYRTGQPQAFDSSLLTLEKQLRAATKLPPPDMATIEREVWYHQFRPFEKAAILYLISFLVFIFASTSLPRRVYKLAMFFALSGFAVHAYGIALRSLISGRPPVSNVYETMLWVPFGTVLFALIFELVYRGKYIGMAATILGGAILLLSDYVSLDPYVSPLVPVLRSNYWLLVHVLTITLGYAAAALCMGLGHLWLLLFMWHRAETPSLKNIEKYLYHAIHVTVLFIGTGTILGGVWANQSWGRYWAWDPKETWALISLLAFLAILHARVVNAVGGFGTAVSSILAWQLVLFCWYGVNYFLVGLHSYAGGDTTAYIPWQIILWAVLEVGFLGLSAITYRRYVKRSQEA